jgi:hypothetical protein
MAPTTTQRRSTETWWSVGYIIEGGLRTEAGPSTKVNEGKGSLSHAGEQRALRFVIWFVSISSLDLDLDPSAYFDVLVHFGRVSRCRRELEEGWDGDWHGEGEDRWERVAEESLTDRVGYLQLEVFGTLDRVRNG